MADGNDWKKADFTAIFKGDKASPCNYRLVSLTSHESEVLESLIRDSIFEHVKNFNLIRDTQEVFWKKLMLNKLASISGICN